MLQGYIPIVRRSKYILFPSSVEGCHVIVLDLFFLASACVPLRCRAYITAAMVFLQSAG
jgi:hypothetical protein